MRANSLVVVGVVGLLMTGCGTTDLSSAAPLTTVGSPAPEPASSATPVDPVSRDAARPADGVTAPALIPVPVPAPEPAAKPVRPGLPTPPPSRRPVAPGPDVEDIAQAISDLGRRLAVPVDEIDVLDARTVTWRTGSVGCPADGMAYTQAEVPGGLIVLAVGNTSYRYHAADGAPFFLCESPESPLEGSG